MINPMHPFMARARFKTGTPPSVVDAEHPSSFFPSQEKPLVDHLGRWFPFLRRFLRRRCILCNLPESRRSRPCPNSDCGTLYCKLCWQDMGRVCFACSPNELVSSDDSSDGETGYAD